MTNETQPFYAFLILACALFVGFIAGGTAQIAAATSSLRMVSASSQALQAINAAHEADQKTKAAAAASSLEAEAPTLKPQSAAVNAWHLDVGRSLFLGTGAVVGIMAFNFISTGAVGVATSATPGIAAIGRVGSQVAIAESSAATAISIYGIVSAVMGAAIGNNLYSMLQADATESDASIPATLP